MSTFDIAKQLYLNIKSDFIKLKFILHIVKFSKQKIRIREYYYKKCIFFINIIFNFMKTKVRIKSIIY